jgi:hypothetical protein
MRLDSVRELKESIRAEVQGGGGLEAAAVFALGPGPRVQVESPARRTAFLPPAGAALALGIAPVPGANGYRLAVRAQHPDISKSSFVDDIHARAKGEIDVRYIGRVTKRASSRWNKERHRPLAIGTSVGHFAITAGSLGCFVRAGRSGPYMILSNNHVLADENAGHKGDAIIQPGSVDGGSRRKDTVATLERFIRLARSRPNSVDCAVASVQEGMEIDPARIRGIGSLKGVYEGPLDTIRRVRKLGRTTGPTSGRVTAFELDDVVISYDLGDIRFDGQLEIAGSRGPFSLGGDSGSLIVTPDLEAFGLLFAGSETGGPSGHGLTYANPIDRVLSALKVRVLT